MEETSRLLTVKETCKYLRISPPTLYRMIERGEMVPVKIGKRTLFDKKDLDGLIDGSKGLPVKKPQPARRPRKETGPKSKPRGKASVEPGSETEAKPDALATVKPKREGKPKAPPEEKPKPKPKPEPDRLF